MAGVNISSVVDKLEGDLVRTREKGLEDLRYLLASSRNGNKLSGLGDDGFHRVFESLYRMVRSDKAAYLKAAQSRTRTQSTNRLSHSATALRLTVEAATSKIRVKTALSIIDHIIQTLPVPNQGFCEPLRNDYLKSFRVLLEYAPYGEHLKARQWQEFVDFTIDGISALLGDEEDSANPSSGRDVSMTSRNGSHVSLRISQSSGQRSTRYGAKSSFDDILGSLRALVTITNAPIMSRASQILDSIFECLVSSQWSHDIVLEIFNAVALTSSTENIQLLTRGVSRLVPLFYKLWSNKATALRDQLLITLSILRPVLLTDCDKIAYLEPELLQKILDTLQDDYFGRTTREMLQFEDVAIQTLGFRTEPSSHVLGPQRDVTRAVSTWSLLSSIACLGSGLAAFSTHKDSGSDHNGPASKRRKVSTPIDEAFDRALHSDGSERLAALHVLFFAFNLPVSLPKKIEASLPGLESALLSEDIQISTWTLALLARFACTEVAATKSHKGFWSRVKEHALRAMTTTSTSRAACLLLETMFRRQLLEPPLNAAVLQDLLFANGKNGPTAFSDAALMMFISILQSDSIDRDELFEAFSNKVVGWLQLHWTLPPVLDRTYNTHLASHGRPELLCSLLSTIGGHPLQFRIHYRVSDLHPIVRAEVLAQDSGDFSWYLAGINAPSGGACLQQIALSSRQLSKEVSARLDHSLSTLLQTKLRDFLSACANYTKERISNAGDDILVIGTSICVSAQANLASTKLGPTSLQEVTKAVHETWQKILELITQDKNDKTIARASVAASVVLRIRDAPDGPSLLSTQFLSMTRSLDDLMRKNRQVIADDEDLEDDILESMTTNASQNSQTGILTRSTDLHRREYVLDELSNSTPICYNLDLSLQEVLSAPDGGEAGEKISRLVDEVLGLDAAALLSARRSIYEMLQSDITCPRKDAARLIKHVAAQCLQDDAYERSEAAICCCAKILRFLAPLWTNELEDDLSDCAFDIYNWFISKALGRGIVSTKALLDISLMLDIVSSLAPSYGAQDDMPSPRTSLLRILVYAPAGLKYQLSSSLSKMFDRYILSEHSAIFNDVVDALPTDPDYVEGIAVRFHILAALGSRWHTVLRQATYHLFETATNVPKLTSLSKLCLQQMSKALRLESPSHLFRAFAPQIFYTWLGTGDIDQMPFEAFGYESLQSLVKDNEAELVAQIALRGSKALAEKLASLLTSTWITLLTEHFAHAEAYCLASQTSIPDHEQLCLNSETLIRKELGSQIYGRRLVEELPSIVTTLFTVLQDDHGIERAFEKAQLSKPLSILQTIRGFDYSSATLPMTQQPSFKSKFIVDEINWLCKRSDLGFDTIWSPAMLSYVYRSLLQGMNPTLGPLHAASVLRVIRSVVCLGTENSLKGYPLEMLLHNLRPFLTVFHCSEDVIGIYKYLLDAGKEHLRENLSFLAGLSVSVFASLTAFISSSQESTTQESAFLSTMSKAKEFQKWLGKFLHALEPNEDEERRLEMFRKLVHHAKSMTQGGSSIKSTPEGNVLLLLLTDRTSEKSLLNETDFYLSVNILCKAFSSTIDPGDDILAENTTLPLYAPVLCTLLDQASVSDSFRTWAAHTLGRACSAFGPVALQSKQVRSQGKSPDSEMDLTASASYSSTVRYLENWIWRDHGDNAAAAERCLQQIASSLDTPAALTLFGTEHDQKLLEDLRFEGLPCPSQSSALRLLKANVTPRGLPKPEDFTVWAAAFIVLSCGFLPNSPILQSIGSFASSAPAAAGGLLPHVVHIVLSAEMNGSSDARSEISAIFSHVLGNAGKQVHQAVKTILDTLVYLRRCKLTTETTLALRNQWLEVDYTKAAEAAAACDLWHEALLFVELQQSEHHLLSGRSTRRSMQDAHSSLPTITDTIFQNVDDPDFFYAGHQDTNLASVLHRLHHESSGYKTVSFQSAEYDATIRSSNDSESYNHAASSAAQALSAANLMGISQAVMSLTQGQAISPSHRDFGDLFFDLFEWGKSFTAGASTTSHNPVMSLRTLTSTAPPNVMVGAIDYGLLKYVKGQSLKSLGEERYSRHICGLALLADARNMLSLRGAEDFDAFCTNLVTSDEWTKNEDIDRLIPVLSGREYLIGAVRRTEELRTGVSLTPAQALLLEARMVRESLRVAQHHSASQFALSRATYLSRLATQAAELGIHFEAASQFDLARTLWSHGETFAAVKLLQGLREVDTLKGQHIPIELSEILTELGTKAAEARLEPPDEIIGKYLIPAYKGLGSNTTGPRAGRVFHDFATFCDAQLQDSDSRDDYTRVEKIRETKLFEMEELERLMNSRDGRNRDNLKQAYSKARTWFKLDDEEFQRLHANRETLILRCLENYLLSMKACDDFPNDSLRVLSIWLDQSENERVNKTVHKWLQHVPSIKFAGLVNQLTSRLMDSQDAFPQILTDLMYRICADHPYHGMYQLFSASKSKGAKSDELANSRHLAATKLGDMLRAKSGSGAMWVNIHNACIAFVRTAQERFPDKEPKPNSKLLLHNLSTGPHLMRTVEGSSKRIPPPTIKIALRADKDYSNVPLIAEFEAGISIAGGISAPKIVTVRGTDGSRNKMLLKGGNDDLRQDSIMEQVFEQVSNLLKDHRPTRQRKLGIRTYKVVPLVANAGIIEFVQNTVALHDYLLPKHTQYFPKDFRPNKCRKEIGDAQTKPLQQRIQTYRTVTASFHPVMRFFFMEKFLDPDDWFYNRLNYSRSTAAISILGHVLGLGDRHGHNILLDEKTGEVVHIDLGIAFEAGRVLPVPEVVPFRLTRDLVDGMGTSGVEGVFRRCCNFTLEALRRDQESIMTILDVLRYDPLYSWSVSPVRLQKMQENAEAAAAAAAAAGGGKNTDTNLTGTSDGNVAAGGIPVAGLAARRGANEPSEADRALTVVAKKLGKSLSVEATVNELIRQATDEKNLAVLYCGWAAYV